MFDAQTILTAFGSWALAGIGVIACIEAGLLVPFLPGRCRRSGRAAAEPRRMALGWGRASALRSA